MVDNAAGAEGDAFFGLYDGHSGIEAAEFAMSKLHLFLFKLVKRGGSNVPTYFQKACVPSPPFVVLH
jgi:hypothetical protein